jgi:hypothetical protein
VVFGCVDDVGHVQFSLVQTLEWCDGFDKLLLAGFQFTVPVRDVDINSLVPRGHFGLAWRQMWKSYVE